MPIDVMRTNGLSIYVKSGRVDWVMKSSPFLGVIFIYIVIANILFSLLVSFFEVILWHTFILIGMNNK